MSQRAKFYRVLVLGLVLMIATSCKLLEGEEDSSSEGGVSLRYVDINCLVTDAIGCSSLNDGATLRVGYIDDCDSFTGSSEVYSFAEATLSCSGLSCELDSPISPSSFSPSSLQEGTYDLYAFIDEDDDDEPDTLSEPIGCKSNVQVNGSTSEVTISDWD